MTENDLPEPFKGILIARKPSDLIRAVKIAIEQRAADASHAGKVKFFESSTAFEVEESWLGLLKDTTDHVDIMGVALMGWRQTNGFAETLIQKAEKGCAVRILMMHPNNPTLPLQATDYELLNVNIPSNYKFFCSIAQQSSKIQIKQLPSQMMHVNATICDDKAIMIQLLGSLKWGKGPIWKFDRQSGAYSMLQQEFDYLWESCK